MNKRYEVQEYTICDGFINTWSDSNGNPSYFESIDDAKFELLSFLNDMKQAFDSGFMADCPELENYRIVELQ